MQRNNTFQDPSLRTGVFEGDLKYGRTIDSEEKSRKDYPAMRNNDGVPTAGPVAPLVQAFKRNPIYWRGRNKHPKKVVNDSSLVDEIILTGVQNKRGLMSQVSSVSFGRTKRF